MASMQGESTVALQDANQLQSTADKLLLQQFTDAHLQLKEHEKITSRALSDRQILEDKVKSLELDLANRHRSLAVSERKRDFEIKEISSALDETRMRLEDAKFVIDKLLQERVTRLDAPPTSLQTRSRSVPRSSLCSRRPYVCVIIDGDANHFLPALLKAGGRGGEAAAERLKQEVSKFIAERRYIPQSCVIKVQIFMNRSGFVDTVNRHDKTPKNVIDSCLDRFFQSQPTWDLVDTGGLRESADTKIKANFNFFVEDSDCFAMVMGVCSDKGYVQILQEYQGDPEKMIKVVLLTSCDTVLNIQNLTYAIVQWPTIFRSTRVSSERCNGLAGPVTKGVTPLEDSVQLASRNFTVVNAGRMVTAPSGHELPKGQLARLPSMPTHVPSVPNSHSGVSAPSSELVRNRGRHRRRKGENIINNEEHYISESGKHSEQFDSTAPINNVMNPKDNARRNQSEQNSSAEPDCELTQVFDVPKTSMPKEAKPTNLARRLSQANGILPQAGPLMRMMMVSRIAARPASLSSTSSNHSLPQNQDGMSSSCPAAACRAGDQITTIGAAGKAPEQPEESTHVSSTPASTVSQQPPPTFSAPDRQSFIHVPMPDRAQEPKHDPDRYLFQQSPAYLTYNHQSLETIISYAKQNYHNTAEAARPQLHRMIEVAEFMITRLWLAQEIQRLEDRAVEKHIRCSRPSTFRCGDAWGNDWYLYCSMSKALGVRIGSRLMKLSNGIARGGLAKMDWVVLTDGRNWKCQRNASVCLASFGRSDF